jgi:type IV pilus assembly protein PilC
LIQQIALGEEHGTLGDALIRTGKRYEVTTERLLEKLPQIMEPAFIVVIGVIIGGMLLALYWPLISIYQAAAR